MSLLWPIVRKTLFGPRRTAAVDDRRTYTRLDILGGAMFMAREIEKATDAPHIGIMLPTSGAFPIALLGAWLARRVAVPLNYLLSPEELEYVIRDSEVDTIITAQMMLDFLKGADDQSDNAADRPRAVPDAINLLHMDKLRFKGLPPLRLPPRYGRDDLAVLLYTSGTSGKPKGVMLTHGNLRSDIDASIDHAGIRSADTFLGVLPQFHSFGLTALTLLPLRVGASTVYSARFIPRKIIGLIKEHRPDIVMAVPSMYGALLSVKNAEPDDFACIRYAISGGEPLPDAVFEAFKERFDVRILEGYGLTETSPITHWSTPARYKRHGVGPALPNCTVAVVDDNNNILGPNEEGEILLAGPMIMKGYYKLEDLTAEVMVELDVPGKGRMRFFRTGDIGKQDEDGILFITGRKKEMLIVGGENVFPREIEEVLNKHASGKSSAIIGRNDGVRGEVPVAFIELEEDATLDESALRSWCRERLAGYKVPRDITVIDELPRSPTGKILRRKLSEAQPTE